MYQLNKRKGDMKIYCLHFAETMFGGRSKTISIKQVVNDKGEVNSGQLWRQPV
jgi:hypothetical protein